MNDIKEYMSKNYPHIIFKNDWKISEHLMYKLGQASAIVKSLEYLPLEPSVRNKLLNVSLIKGAQATTAIEGNTLSEEEIIAISKGDKLPESRQYLEIEVKNVLEALNSIFREVVAEGATAYVSNELICSFHRMIGKDLGEHFEAIPGRFRENNVHVATYRAPEYRYVPELMKQFCDWLKAEFGFKHDEEQDFRKSIIEAIVAHVYIAWIHPFGDGNGRAARLIEFYLLLRSGMPNICSHILSNHYNQTRSEYYRQLDKAGTTRQLTDFIEYAVQGLLDGLDDVLWDVQQHQIANAWKNYVYEIFDEEQKINQPKRKRLRLLVLSMDLLKNYTLTELQKTNVDVAAIYRNLSARTIDRDVDDLVGIGLLTKSEGKYCASISKLVSCLPRKRHILKAT